MFSPHLLVDLTQVNVLFNRARSYQPQYMDIATLTDSVSPITAHKQTCNIIYVWQHLGYSIPLLVSTLTYRAIAIYQPPYLASLLYVSTIPRQLRASTSQQLSIPRTKLNLAKRAFLCCCTQHSEQTPNNIKILCQKSCLFP